MAYYAKIKDGIILNYPYQVSDMKTDFPQVDFTKGLTEEVLIACSAVTVKIGEIPKHSSSTHTFTSNAVINENNEVEVVITAHERRIEEASYNIRKARNIALSQTDWIVVRSAERKEAVPENYVRYREALRTIASQEGFPYAVIWPVLDTA